MEIPVKIGEAFNFKPAQKLSNLTCGEGNKHSENIRVFIYNTEFYHDSLNEVGKTTILQFLLKCKIQGKALRELCTSKPTSFTDLKALLMPEGQRRESADVLLIIVPHLFKTIAIKTTTT